MVSDYNFQKGSLLFDYLEGKGGDYDGDGNIIVKAGTVSGENTGFTGSTNQNLVKIASADNSFMGASAIAANQQNDLIAGKPQTISSNNETSDLVVDFSPMTVQGNFLVSPSSFYDEESDEQRFGIIRYAVEEGDTASSIATSFGISTYTVLWANNLKVGDFIKPGQELDILPVTGIKHAVNSSDTIENIAKKYKADAQEIIYFNELPASGQLITGRILIIPNGEKEEPIEAPRPQPAQNQGSIVSTAKYAYKTSVSGIVNRFPYGQCTWYVASRTNVPWNGNARAWLVNAASMGYATGRVPAAGAIMVTNEHRIYGHVAYVESVTETTVTISEMNYVGWARKSVRVLDRNSSVIMGYVYK